MSDYPSIGVRMLRTAPWSANPLMRPADRALAVLRVLAVLACLLAIPLAGAIGTAVYGDHSERIRFERATKVRTTATVIDDPAPVRTDRGTQARVRWDHGGRGGEATVPIPATASRGDQVPLWLDTHGYPTEPPVWPGAAAVAGFGAAAGMITATALLGSGICAAADRILLRHQTRLLDTEWRQFSPGHH
ncbi:hypothetical protein [Nocardia sp. BMG51109]|uniref:Rv1733c family protein n=1 Tax=Nocardia sp. BMG51109 TaxID=1056816 RepID=UPI0004BB71E3|nr:hypothetical protein [Nocardia sp. BMG51109]